MRAAEKLIAERGIENTLIRDIVNAAGQKNESALQYHFGNLTQLIDAVVSERSEQTHARRAELLDALLAQHSKPALREICMLMVQPSFELARESVDFRRYIKAFGQKLVLTEASPLAIVYAQGGGGSSGKQTRALLKQALPTLDKDAFERRMEAAVRLSSVSMYHQARQKSPFKGERAELFLHNLVDALVGVFSAPVSPATKALAQRSKRISG